MEDGPPPGEPDESRAEPLAASARVLGRLRRALAAATAIMVALSWPLWTPSASFPRVPFLRGVPGLPTRAEWALAIGLEGLLVAAALGLAARAAVALSLPMLAVLILQDQHRFQPWAYQYLMLGLLASSLPAARGVVYARWWMASIYAYSGLSKLDRSFCDELGRLFLETALRPLGLSSDSWPPAWRTAAVLAMPAAEVAFAVALCIPRLRLVGLFGVLGLHAALIAILGPWGLGHSTIVLVWNAAMMVELAILFGTKMVPIPTGVSGPRTGVVSILFGAGMILPLGERLGITDAWPSHALYASHVERTLVDLHEGDLAEYPEVVVRHCKGDGPWRRLDLTGWSREVRGVPVYPQARACNALAEALAARYGGPRLVRVTLWGRADRWSGRRTHQELLGLEAIRRQGDRYWLNAHPSGREPRPANRVGP